jgi:hypothetical protein
MDDTYSKNIAILSFKILSKHQVVFTDGVKADAEQSVPSLCAIHLHGAFAWAGGFFFSPRF